MTVSPTASTRAAAQQPAHTHRASSLPMNAWPVCSVCNGTWHPLVPCFTTTFPDLLPRICIEFHVSKGISAPYVSADLLANWPRIHMGTDDALASGCRHPHRRVCRGCAARDGAVRRLPAALLPRLRRRAVAVGETAILRAPPVSSLLRPLL